MLAVFWKKGRATPVVIGMLASLTVMTAIQFLPQLEWSKHFWTKWVGVEVFWPWFTLIGTTVTLLTAWIVRSSMRKKSSA